MAALRRRYQFSWPRTNELVAHLCCAQAEAMPVDCSSLPGVSLSRPAPAARDPFGQAAGGAALPPGEVVASSAAQLETAQTTAQTTAGAGASAGGSGEPTSDDVAALSIGQAAGGESAAACGEEGGEVVAGAAAELSSALSERFREISGQMDVHFHPSGSAALIASARLARVNTGKPLLVTFGGGAHGWGDGVATESLSLGEERYACDVLTLKECSAATLRVLRLRREEIAAVLVNPLRGLLSDDAASPAPPAPPASPAAGQPTTRRATSSVGTAGAGGHSDGGERSYRAWLADLRATCTKCGLPLIFDETCTGFRLSRGGAQSYFGVQADVICYGSSGAGGLPLGALCGPSWLLAPSAPHLPLRAGAESTSGGAAHNPALLGRALTFLNWLDAPAQKDLFERQAAAVARWAQLTNQGLRAAGLPLTLRCEGCVWSLRFERAGRYHWLLQILLFDAGGRPTWIAPGKLGFPLQTSEAEMERLRRALLSSAERMRTDGWWADEAQLALCSDSHIRMQLAREAVWSICTRLHVAACSLLPDSVAARC